MGTSSDFSGGRGGAWTGYKRAASSFAKHGGSERAGRALARHVGTMGGAGGAAGSAASGARGAQRLGGFLAGVAAGGLAEGLERLGLGHLIGQSRFDVLTGLIEEIAGTGGDLEAVAAQSAALDVLDELLPDGADYAELDQLTLDETGVKEALERFLAAYLYNRASAVIEERLNRLDPQAAETRDEEIRSYVESLVELRMAEVDPMTIDWGGSGGREASEGLLRDLYDYLEAQDQ
jgi:hypothetical protein